MSEREERKSSSSRRSKDGEDKERKSKKHHKREADKLEDDEHKKEVKRMRTWSNADEDDAPSNGRERREKDETEREAKRRRTRAMDAEEERKALQVDPGTDPVDWRKEHSITVQGHGDNRNHEIPQPFFTFDMAPFNANIQKSLKAAGFDKPTAIQAQAWPIGIQKTDMICIAKTGCKF